MKKIDNAIILIAGMGTRLKPMTDHMPKCLTEIHGKTILENALTHLEKTGVKETVLVVGYLGNKVMEKIGSQFGGMKITYIENKVYDKTNNMYSLWLAREYLKKDVIWMDGDVFFEEEILNRILNFDKTKSCWVVDNFTEEFDGAMLTADGNERITDLEIIREKSGKYRNLFFKSAGILRLTPEFGNLFSKWLDEDVIAGNVNIYCDLVLAKHFREIPIYIHNINGLKWAEIDNLEDLKRAERIFLLK